MSAPLTRVTVFLLATLFSSLVALGVVNPDASVLPEGVPPAPNDRDEARRQALAAMDRPLLPPDASADAPSPARPVRTCGEEGAPVLVLLLLAGAAYAAYRFALAPRWRKAAAAQPLPEPAGVTLFSSMEAVRKLSVAAAEFPVIANPRFLDVLAERQLLPPSLRQTLELKHPADTFAALLDLLHQWPQQREALGKAWADSLSLAYMDPTKTIAQPEWLTRLGLPFATTRLVAPIHELNEVLTVAMADPGNRELAQHVEDKLGTFVSPVFAFPDQIQEALEMASISLNSLENLLVGMKSDAVRIAESLDSGASVMRQIASSRSTVEFVRTVLILALKGGASDIHIEPSEHVIRIRFRVDGVLRELTTFPVAMLPAVVNVLKIIAGADIAEKRKPQDGRITVPLGAQTLDMRFSCVPTIYGEKMVLRLLGQNLMATVPAIEDMAFSHANLAILRRIIHSPNGVFFVTGPTGSGKTTTLYSALRSLDRTTMNIMTIEDPVEYRLSDVNQVQVNPPAGVTFATALRAFLRQDPDVVLVGEIRDLETASIAAQAALTGHLVMATMHTNNSFQAIWRLIQIGVEPFLVAPAVIGVMAQRLVRRLCDACKERYALSPEQIQERFVWDGHTPVELCRPKGCPKCHFTGYKGRLAIHEIFLVDEETRDLIVRNTTIIDIQRHAEKNGFESMRYDGFKKVLRGLTTFDEVDEVTVAEA